MNSFLSHIIQRHTLPAENIQPRLQSRFEGAQSNGFEPVEETTVAAPMESPSIVKRNAITTEPVSEMKTVSTISETNHENSPVHANPQQSHIERQAAPMEGKLADHLPKKQMPSPNVEVTPLAKVFAKLPEQDVMVSSNNANPSLPRAPLEQNPSLVLNNSNTTNTEQTFTTENNFLNTVFNNSTLNDHVKMEFTENHFQALQQTPGASSVIKVSIGRIDIRATPSNTAVKENQSGSSYKPQLSLEAYLKNRNSR